jgi:DNA polymerase/3'-5' exonuclease PolX
MKLAFAEKCAAAVVEILTPHCERVVVVGSIRRRRPEVGDVDLIAIPKWIPQRDLFGRVTAEINPAAEALTLRGAERGWSITVNGEETFRAVSGSSKAGYVQCDVWWTRAAYWPSVLVCRTGPVAHNIACADIAKGLGLHWRANFGLERVEGGKLGLTPLVEEEDFYRALRLPWIAPEARDEWARARRTPHQQSES